MGLDAALDFHNAIGAERIHQRIKFLGDYLREGLRKIPGTRIYTSADPAMCAGITVYSVDGVTGPKLQDEMWTRARLRPRANGPGVRHSAVRFNPRYPRWPAEERSPGDSGCSHDPSTPTAGFPKARI